MGSGLPSRQARNRQAARAAERHAAGQIKVINMLILGPVRDPVAGEPPVSSSGLQEPRRE
jgi:hypothetical protein